MQIKSGPQPRIINSTSTQSPTKADSATPSQPIEEQKPASSPALNLHTDHLGKEKSAGEASPGHTAFKSQKDVAALNSRRDTVFSTRARPAGTELSVAAPLSAGVTQVQERAVGKPTVQDVCIDLMAKREFQGHVKVQVFILQGADDVQSAVADAEIPESKRGVCVAMASEWIRSSLQDAYDKQDGVTRLPGDTHLATFRQMASGDQHGGRTLNAHFRVKQQEFSEASSELNHLFSVMKDASKASDAAKEKAFPTKLWGSMSKLTRSPQESQAAVADYRTAMDAADTAKKAAGDAYQAELNRQVGGLSEGIRYKSDEQLQSLAGDFAKHFPSPGYYQLSLFKADGSGGHEIAVEIGPKPRLLDANTGEFTFESQAKMNDFMKDFLGTVYRDYSSGTFDGVFYAEKTQAQRQAAASATQIPTNP